MIEKERIALLIGTGSVENAWNPVLKAFKEVTGLQTTPDGANFIFAKWIYILRFYSTIKDPNAPMYLKIQQQNVYLLKKAVAKNLHKAKVRNEINARPALKKILQKYVVLKEKSFGIITTNWDTTVDDIVREEIKRIGIHSLNPVFHIHGYTGDFQNLYLPSEMTDETYRSREESFKIGVNHSKAIEFLEKSNHMIIYGLSLDPLDAELAQILTAACYSEHLKEITIINLDVEKIKIMERVRLMLFPREGVKVTFLEVTTI